MSRARWPRALAVALPISLAILCSASAANLQMTHQGKLNLPDVARPDEQVELQIYDLAGRSVYDSGPVQGRTLQWNLQNSAGQLVANGVYLYQVTFWDGADRARLSSVKKLIVLR